MGGLALTMSTGIGAPIPGPYLLASVAAVVLGGVALGGGRGGIVGPIVAVFILRLVRTDLTLLAVDPNVTAIIEGTIMVVVVMFGAYHRHAGTLVMSQSAATTPATLSLGRRISRFMSDQPLVPLIILLIVLIVILQILRPGIINERWIANTIRFAIPLAILAGCQTMTMLTGGIDLSVGTVATMSAFIMVTQAVVHDPAVAIVIALIPAHADRPRQWHRRRRLPRASADHDARHQPDRHRLPPGLSAHRDRLGRQDSRKPGLARHRHDLWLSQRAAAVRAASPR